jgi:hypothetical protein
VNYSEKLVTLVKDARVLGEHGFKIPKPIMDAVMPATTPVKVGLFNGAFVPMSVVMVVENCASLPKAKASPFKVSSAPSAAFTKLDTGVATYANVA